MVLSVKKDPDIAVFFGDFREIDVRHFKEVWHLDGVHLIRIEFLPRFFFFKPLQVHDYVVVFHAPTIPVNSDKTVIIPRYPWE